MFGSLGFPEIVLIFVVILLLFGPKKLPDVAKMLGKTIREFGKRRRKDGTLVDVEILGEPIEINGKRIGVLGLYRDITVEKHAKEELQASEERFRRMFHDSPVAMQLEDFSEKKRWVLEMQEKSGKDIREFLSFAID